ncbi:uncharacterized protein LOC132199152 [Neocloeon triangulifer]|uniref:uncharacterized protein LOC132199152 n=1 Tax=Neocloeon triangulifer TaxID=2078957 RepID=UPI00286ED1C5|nr:uncharacterized protein LOC132199152 [Neocloeon triangulifer]
MPTSSQRTIRMLTIEAFLCFLIIGCAFCVSLDEANQNTVNINQSVVANKKNEKPSTPKAELAPSAGNVSSSVDNQQHSGSKSKKKDKAIPDASWYLANKTLLPVTPEKVPPSTIDSTESGRNSSTAIAPVGPGGRVNSGSLLRGFYVFLGLGLIVIMYLVARTVRLKQKVTRVHKYGIISNRDDLEMAPLEIDDDENEVLFELPIK